MQIGLQPELPNFDTIYIYIYYNMFKLSKAIGKFALNLRYRYNIT